MEENLNKWLEYKRRHSNCGGLISHSYSRICSLCQSYCSAQNSLAFHQTSSFAVPCLFLNLPHKAMPKQMLSLILTPPDASAMAKIPADGLMMKIKQRIKVYSTEILLVASPNYFKAEILSYIYAISTEMGVALILAGTPELLSTIEPNRFYRSGGSWDCYWVD